MVDAAFLAAMKDGALLVNAARGVVVDTDALLAELTAGRLRAALDVTDPEPLPEGHPLWSAPGLLLTPHVAGAVPDTNARAAAASPTSSAASSTASPLENVVDRLLTASSGSSPGLEPERAPSGAVGEGIRPPESAARRGRSRARRTGSRTSVPWRGDQPQVPAAADPDAGQLVPRRPAGGRRRSAR